MNRRGQALVEFVLILPIIIFLLLAIYDFGMIFNNKNMLTSNMADIISLYKDGKTEEEIENMYPGIDITVSDDGEYKKIMAKTKVKIVTPGLNRVFGNPHVIEVERYLINNE